MIKRVPRTIRAASNKHDTELMRLSAALDEMKREFRSQKQELEQKIQHLEHELVETRKVVQTNAKPLETEEKTSRRRMLKRLGVAAAGVAAATVATGLTQEIEVAQAANTYSLQGGEQTPANNTSTNPTTISAGPSGPSFNTLTIQNNFTSGTSGTLDALVVSSTSGVGLNAINTNASTSGVLGVSGSNTGINADLAINNLQNFASGVTGSSDNKTGLAGFSKAREGVFGFSSGNYGGVFQVGVNAGATAITGSAPLLIVPEPQTGAPASGSHARGELHVDRNGDLWLCTAGGSSAGVGLSTSEIRRRHPSATADDQNRLAVGAPPAWTKVNSTGSILNILSTPIRIVGPNNTVNPNFVTTNLTPSYFKIEGTWTNNNPGGAITDTIPSNAVSIVGAITIIYPANSGYGTVFPGNLTSAPVTASVGYAGVPGNISVSTVLVKLGALNSGPDVGKKGIGVITFTSVLIAFDVFAYYL